ncbi:MAG: fibrobacter succinogenes major paralogous domain-containing protein [Bacteroidia bacterium]|nr:fibrobacter succinogenes major paralogous domain-containing protein [Bacteroidia bacterium]
MRHNKIEFSVVLLFGLGLTGLQAQTVKDIDGNVYKTVTIGTQTWMAENLKTTRLNDSTSIPLITADAEWTSTKAPAYSWYENAESKYKNTYGALYKGYSVYTGKLCPSGWHIPGNDDWMILIDFLGGIEVAGDKLKEKGTTHWMNRPATTKATNSSGFTALPGGSRSQAFGDIGFSGYWWSSTLYSTNSSWFYLLDFSLSKIQKDVESKADGLSVRCVKN